MSRSIHSEDSVEVDSSIKCYTTGGCLADPVLFDGIQQVSGLKTPLTIHFHRQAPYCRSNGFRECRNAEETYPHRPARAACKQLGCNQLISDEPSSCKRHPPNIPWTARKSHRRYGHSYLQHTAVRPRPHFGQSQVPCFDCASWTCKAPKSWERQERSDSKVRRRTSFRPFVWYKTHLPRCLCV